MYSDMEWPSGPEQLADKIFLRRWWGPEADARGLTRDHLVNDCGLPMEDVPWANSKQDQKWWRATHGQK